MKRFNYTSQELAEILLRNLRLSWWKKKQDENVNKNVKKATDWADSQDWSECSNDEKWIILDSISFSLNLPFGLIIEEINGKHEGFFYHESHLQEFIESLNEYSTEIMSSVIKEIKTAFSSSYVAIISAIITERLKRNLHRLSVPYPHFDILPLNEPSFTVQNILTVFEGFSLSIFSRPPPLLHIHQT
tara:strand:- start:486 stop:1049 length:564 start_codon:yes stop_codon:yes gene_type:complete